MCSYCEQRVAASAQELLWAELRSISTPVLAPGDAAEGRGRREALSRGIRKIDDTKRTNAIVSIAIGVLFWGFALACFGSLVASVVNDGTVSAGPGAFGLFWAALGGLILFIGVRGWRQLALKKRLMTIGLRGSATVLRWDESRMKVDGANVFKLELRLELAGRPSWNVTRRQAVLRSTRIYTNAKLVAFFDPNDPEVFVIDWWV